MIKPSVQHFLTGIGYVLDDGVFINPVDSLENHGFEQAYLETRQKEGRLYDIKTIRELPDVPENHPLAAEWEIRRRSAEKLSTYLIHRKNMVSILEIGCGNGWLTHYLAKGLPDSHFTGMDVNLAELKQASETFEDCSNITWLFDEITNPEVLPGHHFDLIYFAASIQYFPDLKLVLNCAAKYLAPGGEIHILDSPFYSDRQMISAKERTLAYYSGFSSGMADYYFHHSYKELLESGFKVKRMNRTAPFSWLKKLNALAGWDHFGWYCLKQ